MDSNTFVYWLQGALELNPEMLEKGMTPEQVQTVQDHLNLVLNKVTPDRFEKKTGIELVQPFHTGPQHTGGIDAGGSLLFCSQVNAQMEFHKPDMIISGCTTSDGEDIKVGTSLLSSC